MPTHFAGEPEEILALDTLIKLTRATNTLLARIAHHNTHPDLTVSQFLAELVVQQGSSLVGFL